jgi:hypothetical protein
LSIKIVIAKILSATIVGLDAEIIEVEAGVSNGLTNTIIVGLPDTAVQESKERVKNAIKNSGAEYPVTRVSVNLAPADLPKLGTHFDLPIALAILLAYEQVNFASQHKLFLGELSLDGNLRAVPGVLAVAIKAKAKGIKELFIPEENAKEAGLVEDIKIIPIKNLKQLLEHLLGVNVVPSIEYKLRENLFKNPKSILDMKDVAGQELAKRALEIAAATSFISNILFGFLNKFSLSLYSIDGTTFTPNKCSRSCFRFFMGIIFISSTKPASLAFSSGINNSFMPLAFALMATAKTPGTARKLPSKDNSPKNNLC